MVTETGREAAALKKSLLDSGQRYGFYQAYRLLRLIARTEGREDSELRIRPQLSLAFQETDIHQIAARSDGGYDLTVNFLGLYGVSSPLPTFYSEDLLDEALEDRHGERDFLDILNQTLYPLFFQAWLKTKLQLRLVEFNDNRLLEVLYTFVGLPDIQHYRNQPGVETLLRFAGIYAQYPRSAVGLRTIIAGTYPQAAIDIDQLDMRPVQIAEDQRCKLGTQANTLGEDSHLGQQIRSRTSNLTIRLGELDETLFHQLLPGNPEYRRLQFIVRYYLIDPLEVRLELNPRRDVPRGISLAKNRCAALGQNSWLAANEAEFQTQIRISL